MPYAFTQTAIIPATPDRVYAAWLDSDSHTAMTGGEAHTTDKLGGSFDAWGGYISGTNVALEPGKRIVQSWRTTNFTDDDADSQIEVTLEAVDGGTKLTLCHSNVPDDHKGYEDGGWQKSYFDPMIAYFGD